jgi:CBS domain-containing protein
MKFKDFKDLVGKLDGNIIDEIESGTILTRSKMKKKCIAVDSSNSEALDKMEQEDINELAVLDSSEQFVGIVTQENLVRKLLTDVIRQISIVIS